MAHYDLLVIGTGPAGQKAAIQSSNNHNGTHHQKHKHDYDIFAVFTTYESIELFHFDSSLGSLINFCLLVILFANNLKKGSQSLMSLKEYRYSVKATPNYEKPSSSLFITHSVRVSQTIINIGAYEPCKSD